jgi:signal transduction histidine kinase/CheY-like chemotaxis protein
MLEEDWRPVKQMLDKLVQQGVKDLRSYFRENPDQLGKAYDAARRFGISRAAVDLYRAANEEELRAAMTQETADPDELTGYGDMISDFHNGAKSFEYEATEIACDGTNLGDSWARVLVTMEDVTERKNVEAQLYQAQRLKSIGQLTGGVAHDFNNLLAVIMGNAEVLAARLGKDDKPAQAVIRAASRGADLTQRLLAFSRQQPLHPHDIDLDGLVNSMLDMLHRTLGETIETRTLTCTGLWPALADPGQLESALLNLAINARDAMPGGGTLTIETANVTLSEDDVAATAEVSPGEYVALVVSDTGVGMPPEVLEHAFEPFFTTKPIGEGSGLGLSMVYGFAKQSDGHVTIDSEQGRGTTLTLYLPRAKRCDQPVPRKAAAFEPTARGERLLVLEDDADVRRLAVSILESLGYDVLQAQSGEAALQALKRSGRVDLLLSDVVLSGGMSGPQVASLAKSWYPAMKILFMSGHAEDAIRRQTTQNGGIELINKPFRRRDLAQKVRAALDGIDA